jgi:iron complex outermembrane receptor protein
VAQKQKENKTWNYFLSQKLASVGSIVGQVGLSRSSVGTTVGKGCSGAFFPRLLPCLGAVYLFFLAKDASAAAGSGAFLSNQNSTAETFDTPPEPSSSTVLPEVTVVGEKGESLVIPSSREAQRTLERVPGGTNFIEASEWERGRSSTLQDALSFQPGVYVQEAYAGPNDLRLSIRGSGVSKGTFGIWGVYVLQDGLPWTFADGAAFGLSSIDLLSMQYAEVYRGANALAYGSATLGGAINFVSQTGYSAPPFVSRFEAGSFGYLRGQLAGGTVEGPGDVYGSLSEFFESGFRDHSEANSIRLNTNLGYRISEDAENRIYYSYINQRQYLPGPLTLAQTESDPEQANQVWQRMDLRRFWDHNRVADLASFRPDPDTLFRVGLYWQNSQLWHPIFTFIHASYNDFGAMLQAQGRTELWGYADHFVAGLLPQGEYRGETDFAMAFGRPDQGPLQANSFSVAANVPLYGENRFYLLDSLALITGLQLGWAYRSNEAFTFLPSPPSTFRGSASSSRDYYGVNPKVGVLWEFEPGDFLYGNFNRSFEPPSFTDLVPAAALLPPGEALFPLSAQRASTVEVGTRGSWDWLRWDVAFYHSWVDDELLIFFPNPKLPTISQTINASPTHHLGLEAALDLWVYRGILVSGENPLSQEAPEKGRFFAGTDGILFRQVYTWSRFFFDHDPVYGQNQLPTIPEHFYQAELLYTHPLGWYLGPNVTLSSRVFTDFKNTLAAPSWAALGFRLGWQNTHGFSFFLDGRNLTNERYAATVNPIVNAAGKDQPVFLPAAGWALYGGVQWAF